MIRAFISAIAAVAMLACASILVAGTSMASEAPSLSDSPAFKMIQGANQGGSWISVTKSGSCGPEDEGYNPTTGECGCAS